MSEELLPCPHCGPKGEVFINKVGNYLTKRRGAEVGCNNCGFKKFVAVLRESLEWAEERAVEQWNARPTIKDSLTVQLSTIRHLIRTHPFSSISDREAMMKGVEAVDGNNMDVAITNAADRISCELGLRGNEDEARLIETIIREELSR